MEESLALFRVILSSDYFANASVILFLNKTDLFPGRLVDKPLRYTFPDYDGNFKVTNKIFTHDSLNLGADTDVETAKQFIKNKYLSLVQPRERYAEKNIYPHFTCSVGKFHSSCFL
jgi:hypothetical protein